MKSSKGSQENTKKTEMIWFRVSILDKTRIKMWAGVDADGDVSKYCRDRALRRRGKYIYYLDGKNIQRRQLA